MAWWRNICKFWNLEKAGEAVAHEQWAKLARQLYEAAEAQEAGGVPQAFPAERLAGEDRAGTEGAIKAWLEVQT